MVSKRLEDYEYYGEDSSVDIGETRESGTSNEFGQVDSMEELKGTKRNQLLAVLSETERIEGESHAELIQQTDNTINRGVRSISNKSPEEIVSKHEIIDNSDRTLAEKLIENEKRLVGLEDDIKNMEDLAENPNTIAEAEKIAIEIKGKISEGLDNLGLTKENTDIRLGGTILLGTEADVAITLMVNLDSAESKNANILAEAVSECYNQYNGLLSLLGQKSASFLIN